MSNKLLAEIIDRELLRQEAIVAYMDDDRDDPNFTVYDMEYELWSKGLRKYSLFSKPTNKKKKGVKKC